MIVHQALRNIISDYLKMEYVALLGQHEASLQMFINRLVEASPIAGMQFISVSLPQGIRAEDEFIELFLRRLIQDINDVRPEKMLKSKVVQELEKSAHRTPGFQLRIVLDILGSQTTATPLVIVLPSLAHTPEEPLRNLLHMLRDYHKQRHMAGKPGKNLRFLIVGDLRLWYLCCNGLRDDESPFGIAKRVFLDGLSYKELDELGQSPNLEVAIQIQSLTGGVPSFIEKVINMSEIPDDLSLFFEQLEDPWNALPEASRQILKRLAEGLEDFPPSNPDYQCPQIPRVKSPWIEAFWKGFLRMQDRELAWHSPIHRAFVMDRTQVQRDNSRSTLVKVDLFERSLRLEKALKDVQTDENKHKYLEEVLSLTVQTQGALLASTLKMLWREETRTTILEKLHQVAADSDKGWMEELEEKVNENQESLTHLLIDAAVWETRRLSGDFDVFLCHNSEDKPSVKVIAEKLLAHGILPWLDIWELRPGLPWQPLLEQQIGRVKTAAVFVGMRGVGPWQEQELRAFLNEFVNRGCPVIPILLTDAPQKPALPLFLKAMTWVDFRAKDPDPMQQLLWGITGSREMRKGI